MDFLKLLVIPIVYIKFIVIYLKNGVTLTQKMGILSINLDNSLK